MRFWRRDPEPPAPDGPPAGLESLVTELERVTAELRALTQATVVERQEHAGDR
jgi:hypothetical protein